MNKKAKNAATHHHRLCEARQSGLVVGEWLEPGSGTSRRELISLGLEAEWLPKSKENSLLTAIPGRIGWEGSAWLLVFEVTRQLLE